MISLHLYGRPTGDMAHERDLTRHALNWQRTTHRLYGHYTAQATITGLNRAATIDLYNTTIGKVIREKAYGMTTWEGIVYELRINIDGVEYVQSLAPEWYRNKVKVIYSSDIGSRTELAWSENTDSSAMYGQMQYIDMLAGATADGATARQVRQLAEYGWPRSRVVGATTLGRRAQSHSLQMSCVGFWATMNWRYRETNETAAASTLIGTLVGETQFVTAGRIETNALSVRVDANPRAQRIGDLIAEIMLQGDASGNPWQGGVYGRELRYEQAPATVTHLLRNGQLTTLGGSRVYPTLVEPGILVRNAMTPYVTTPPGTSSVWDDPTVGYVEQVTYARPDALALSYYGQEAGMAVMAAQMQGGSA